MQFKVLNNKTNLVQLHKRKDIRMKNKMLKKPEKKLNNLINNDYCLI